MKRVLLSLLILVCLPFTILSQSCLPEGIIFTSQAEIDSFQVNYPGCTEILGNLVIGDPDGTNIEDLSSLSVLTSIGGSLSIGGNHDLLNLSGLENLSAIEGNLQLDILDIDPYSMAYIGNYSLESMEALNNLTSFGGNLEIINNPDLSFCELAWICDYLADPPGIVNIQSNGSGCGSVIEFALACGDTLPCLPYGHYWFGTQSDIDHFPEVFPGCTDLVGDLVLTGFESILNLEGLSGLNSIGRDLSIFGCFGLTSLSGLQNLVSIGRHLNIEGGSFADLTGLNNINHIGGGLTIYYNDSLTSLDGLDNLPGASISDLLIMENHVLSTCHVQCICDYLAAPNGFTYIQDNAPGCNYEYEVEAACETISVNELHPEILSKMYPNPVSGQLTINFTLEHPSQVKLEVLSPLGQVLATALDGLLPQGNHEITWNAEGLPSGVYFYRISNSEYRQSTIGKMVVR